jgi:KRAB domain-containing zinc finger protein
MSSFIISGMETQDKKEIKQEERPGENPWSVESLEEFLYFCCPECPDKIQSKTVFISHAWAKHPKAQNTLENLNIDVEQVKVEADIKVKFEVEQLHDELFINDHNNDDIVDIVDVKETYKDGDGEPNFEIDNEEEQELQCFYCGDMMCQSLIKGHQLDKHGGYCGRMYGKPRPIQCPKCKGTFEKDSTLGLHSCYDTFIPKKKVGHPYKCEKCSKEFVKRQSFRYHLQTAHTDQKNFQCTQCSYCTKTLSLLNRHIERVHDKLLSHMCPECGKQFCAATQLTLHKRRVHQKTNKQSKPKSEFKCEKCEASFDLKLRLTKHLQSHHNIEPDRKYICDECGKSFSQTSGLQTHIKFEHPSNEDLNNVECLCLVCKVKFETSNDLNKHQIDKHDKLESKDCDHCETRWTSSETLKKHIAETHRLIVFPCELCNKTFSKNYSKNAHIKEVHHHSDEFSCKQCSKVCVNQYRLNLHVQSIHGNGGDFKCDFCNYRSVLKNMLDVHVQATHIKKIRYECQQCSFFSYRKDCLKMHIKTVHERVKNHKCDLCDMAFFARRDKIKHMAKHV